MVLGGVVEGEEAKRVILDAITSRDSVKPFTPYMHHYAVEALFKAKAEREGEEYIRRIWGAMARTGADTFQEVFVPDDPNFSPYGDRMIKLVFIGQHMDKISGQIVTGDTVCFILCKFFPEGSDLIDIFRLACPQM